MEEIRSRRSLNAKHYLTDDVKCAAEIHVGHIHYDNKLGFGDGQKGLRGIDYTFLWDEERKGWYFNFGSFNPFIPEYSDDWAEFRDLFEDKDQTTKIKPDCQHIRGRLVKAEELKEEGLDSETGFNCIVYDNAFGEGIDLVYAIANNALRKIVRIRKNAEKKDYKFKFETLFPKDVYRAFKKEDVKDLENSSYKLDLTKKKSFDTKKKCLIGLPVDGKEWATYIGEFKLWEREIGASPKRLEYVNVDFSVEDGKTYLVKNIPKEFIENSNEDVFTDSEISPFSSNDGVAVRNSDGSTWSSLISGNGTSHDDTTTYDNMNVYMETGLVANTYDTLHRMKFIFDTSSLPDSSTVYFAVLNLMYYAGGGTYDGADKDTTTYNVYENTGSNTDIEDSDYQNNNSVALCDIAKPHSSFTDSAYTKWYLNSTGISKISKTATPATKLAIRNTTWDVNASAPSGGTNQYWSTKFYSSRYTGTDKDPYLLVGYVDLSSPKTVKVLCVGGGGGGGGAPDITGSGGGGGAGGVIYNSSYTVDYKSYSVTVGSGGTAGPYADVGGDGGNSVFDYLVAVGGGGGGKNDVKGRDGGSGGGGSSGNNPSGGVSSTVYTTGGGNSGGSGYSGDYAYPAGGGGGAGAAGNNGTSTAGGAGGVGSAYSISGSSVYYGGGGGGGVGQYSSGSGGAGGNGGGGAGGKHGGDSPVDGTANRGGGGGGAGGGVNSYKGAAGGSGVVIIRYATADFGPCTGGTITTDGSDTIHTFTSNGTMTFGELNTSNFFLLFK